MVSAYLEWDEWLASLPEDERARAVALRARFAELGATDPQEWARTEVEEDVPQLARFLILRQIWRDAINSFEREGQVEMLPAARRLLDAGAEHADVVAIARRAAYDAAYATLYAIDVPHPNLDDESLPEWRLHETAGDGRHAGRHIDYLHADLVATDPSGRDAEDLLF